MSWDRALDVLAELKRSSIAAERVLFAALSSVFARDPRSAVLSHVQLPFLERGERVCCSVGPLADMLLRGVDEKATLEDALRHWLLPRQAERIATYVRQGKIVMGVQLTKGEDERLACLALLAGSSTPVEVQDLACSRSQDLH